MDITSVYNTATLAELKTSNDAYIVNKAMNQELNTIRLKVLGHNNLYGDFTSSYVTHQYTSVAGNDYFGTLLQKLYTMFPGSYIYYTRGSDSSTSVLSSVLSSSLTTPFTNVYAASHVSVITNTIFISQIDLSIGQIVFTYTGIAVPNMTVTSHIPFITAPGVTIVSATATISSNTGTVTINTQYTLPITTNDNYGLSFANTNNFYNELANLNITTINNIPLSKNGSQFQNLTNLSIVTGQNPIIRIGTSLDQCFSNCINFNSDISGWNTSNVTDMSYMFMNCQNFNKYIGNWNTSNVTNMANMFSQAIVFNQPIGSWNTSNVTNMSYMFVNDFAFNQPIGSWNTSKVTDMSYMFNNQTDNSDTLIFNQNIGNWIMNNVVDISYMFFRYSGFVSFNNDGQKMNWQFNASPNSTNWHLDSVLTQQNAPTSLPW
jgi:surface protein